MKGSFRRSAAAITLVLPLLTACSASRSETGPTLRAGTTSPPGPRLTLRVGQSALDRGVDVDVQVNEAAYVLAVAVDFEGAIRVLHPASPAEATPIAPEEMRRLAHFFPGVGTTPASASTTLAYRSTSGLPGAMRLGKREGGGVVIAIASASPLHLDRIEQDGGFSVSAIEGALFGNTVAIGTERLAQLVATPDQRLSAEFRRLAGSRGLLGGVASAGACLPSPTAPISTTPQRPSAACLAAGRPGPLGFGP